MLDKPLIIDFPPGTSALAATIYKEQQREIGVLMTENAKLNAALRMKDEAMGVLFERLAKAGVDCSDLIP